MSIELRSQIKGDAAVLYCSGQLAADDEAGVLRATVSDLLQQRPEVIVDLAQIDYMDSSSLSVLVGLYSSARTAKSNLKFVNLGISVDYSRTGYHRQPAAGWRERVQAT